MTGTNRKRDWQKLFWRLLSVVVTVALLYFVVAELGEVDLRELVSRVDMGSWLAALSIYLILNLFRALRFRILLGGGDAPWRLLIPITLYHNGLVRIIPFKLGEISYVLLLKSRLNYTMQEGVGSLVGARVLELLIIVLVFAFGILLGGTAFAEQRDGLMLLIVVIFIVSLAGLYFAGGLIRLLLRLATPLFQSEAHGGSPLIVNIKSRLLALAKEFDRIRAPRLFFPALFISGFTYSGAFLTNYVLMRAMGVEADLFVFITVVSLGMFGSAFPFSLSGFGTVETAWWFGLTRFAGYVGDEAAAIAIVLHGFQIVAAIAYGLAGYALIRLTPPLKANDSEQSDPDRTGD